MNNESMLQKDFKSKDVQRLRNIVSKKYGDKTVTQSKVKISKNNNSMLNNSQPT